MMCKKYPGGQYDAEGVYHPSLADSMVKALWSFLEQTGQGLVFNDFAEKIENWVNNDEKG